MSKARGAAVVGAVVILTSLLAVATPASAADAITLSGRVVAADTGAALAGVEVDVISVQDGFAGPGPRVAAFTHTGSDGTWTVGGLSTPVSPGFWVCFQTAFPASENIDYAPRCYDDAGFYSGVGASGYAFVSPDANPIPAVAGQSVTGVDAHLLRVMHESYSGRVTAADSGLPLAGVRIQVLDSSNAGRPYLFGSGYTTAADGSYAVAASITPGSTAYLCVSTIATGDDGYADQCWNGAAWTALNSITDPPAPGATPLPTGYDLAVTGMDVRLPRLPANGSVAGTLRASDGQPLAGATVEVFHSTNGTPAVVTTTRTGADGTYRAVVPNNEVDQVCFTGTGITGGPSDRFGYLPSCVGLPAWDPAVPPTGFTTDVEVVGDTAGVDGVMQSAGEIAGTVTETGVNLALRGVAVSVFGPTGALVATGATTANGSFRVDQLAAGSYRVCFDGRPGKGGLTLHWYASQCWSRVAWRPASPPPSAAGAVPVSAGASTGGINATLRAA